MAFTHIRTKSDDEIKLCKNLTAEIVFQLTIPIYCIPILHCIEVLIDTPLNYIMSVYIILMCSTEIECRAGISVHGEVCWQSIQYS